MISGDRSKFYPRLCVAILAALILNGAGAQDLSQFDKVLVPVFNMVPIAGANGSKFTTILDVWSNLQPVTYYPAPMRNGPVIGISEPQLLQFFLWEAPVVARGRFVFLEKAAADDPIAATVNGVPLPIVHERDVLARKSTFMPLPVNPVLSAEDPSSPEHFHLLGYAERYTLRIYDWDSTGTMEVAVRLIRGYFLAQRAVGEISVRADRHDFDDPSYPFYAEIDLQRSFPAWCYPGLHTACTPYPAIVEVEPTNPGARYYAFVSRTDNQTNQITIFTPR